MKKLVSFGLLIIYMLSTTEFHELLKLPALVDHFIEHRLQNRDLSFSEFLDVHYNSGEIRDADFERDMQLPFKSHEGHIHVMVSFNATMPEDCEIEIDRTFNTDSDSFILYNQDLLPQSYLSEIWQPPRTC